MTKKVNNFAGQNGFVWWVGAVENRMDPLAIGRCQVRIFGWYGDEIPTADLPWAQPMYSLNGISTGGNIKPDDWVMGFFLDGENAQSPVMMGFLPGLKQK